MGPLVYTSGNPKAPLMHAGIRATSMGPLVYTSGNWVGAGVVADKQKLQWGRWFTPAETYSVSDFMPRYTTTSMGPLVYTSGNRSCGVRRPGKWPGLQWGRWFTPAET